MGDIFSPGGLGLGDLSYLNFDLASLGAANAKMDAQLAAYNVTVNLQGGINIGSQYEFQQSVTAAVQAANTAGNALFRAGVGP
jgi:hypothetical protein